MSRLGSTPLVPGRPPVGTLPSGNQRATSWLTYIVALLLVASSACGDAPDRPSTTTPGPSPTPMASLTPPPSPDAETEEQPVSFSVIEEVEIDRNQVNRYALVVGSDPEQAAIDCANETNAVDVERYCWVFWTVSDFEVSDIGPSGGFETPCWVAEAGAGVGEARVNTAIVNTSADVVCDGYIARLGPPSSDEEVCEQFGIFVVPSMPSPAYADYVSKLGMRATDEELAASLEEHAGEARQDPQEIPDQLPVLERCVELGY